MNEIRKSVDTFTKYVAEHPGLHFLVTPVGCGGEAFVEGGAVDCEAHSGNIIRVLLQKYTKTELKREEGFKASEFFPYILYVEIKKRQEDPSAFVWCDFRRGAEPEGRNLAGVLAPGGSPSGFWDVGMIAHFVRSGRREKIVTSKKKSVREKDFPQRGI